MYCKRFCSHPVRSKDGLDYEQTQVEEELQKALELEDLPAPEACEPALGAAELGMSKEACHRAKTVSLCLSLM